MKKSIKAGLAAVFAAMLATSALAAPPGQDATGSEQSVVPISASDAEMNRAIEQARASLNEFLERLDAGLLNDADMLKVGLPTFDGSEEHIWVAAIRREGDGFSGELANDPVAIPYVRGDRVSFDSRLISDWSYESRGRLWGNFTTRAMLSQLSPAQAAQLRAILSDTPIEP